MISVLMVTKCEPHTSYFISAAYNFCAMFGYEFVLGIDNAKIPNYLSKTNTNFVHLKSSGCIEDILDQAISNCSGDYIFRIDDDEIMDGDLMDWLVAGEFESDVYSFPRINWWKHNKRFYAITTPPLYPDIQTRFATKEKSGGRKSIHAGSPFGAGKIVEAPIHHMKFVERTYQERLDIATRYESILSGAGFGNTYQPYNLPEHSFKSIELRSYGKGKFRGDPIRVYFGGEA